MFLIRLFALLLMMMHANASFSTDCDLLNEQAITLEDVGTDPVGGRPCTAQSLRKSLDGTATLTTNYVLHLTLKGAYSYLGMPSTQEYGQFQLTKPQLVNLPSATGLSEDMQRYSLYCMAYNHAFWVSNHWCQQRTIPAPACGVNAPAFSNEQWEGTAYGNHDTCCWDYFWGSQCNYGCEGGVDDSVTGQIYSSLTGGNGMYALIGGYPSNPTTYVRGDWSDVVSYSRSQSNICYVNGIAAYGCNTASIYIPSEQYYPTSNCSDDTKPLFASTTPYQTIGQSIPVNPYERNVFQLFPSLQQSGNAYSVGSTLFVPKVPSWLNISSNASFDALDIRNITAVPTSSGPSYFAEQLIPSDELIARYPAGTLFFLDQGRLLIQTNEVYPFGSDGTTVQVFGRPEVNTTTFLQDWKSPLTRCKIEDNIFCPSAVYFYHTSQFTCTGNKQNWTIYMSPEDAVTIPYNTSCISVDIVGTILCNPDRISRRSTDGNTVGISLSLSESVILSGALYDGEEYVDIRDAAISSGFSEDIDQAQIHVLSTNAVLFNEDAYIAQAKQLYSYIGQTMSEIQELRIRAYIRNQLAIFREKVGQRVETFSLGVAGVINIAVNNKDFYYLERIRGVVSCTTSEFGRLCVFNSAGVTYDVYYMTPNACLLRTSDMVVSSNFSTIVVNLNVTTGKEIVPAPAMAPSNLMTKPDSLLLNAASRMTAGNLYTQYTGFVLSYIATTIKSVSVGINLTSSLGSFSVSSPPSASGLAKVGNDIVGDVTYPFRKVADLLDGHTWFGSTFNTILTWIVIIAVGAVVVYGILTMKRRVGHDKVGAMTHSESSTPLLAMRELPKLPTVEEVIVTQFAADPTYETAGGAPLRIHLSPECTAKMVLVAKVNATYTGVRDPKDLIVIALQSSHQPTSLIKIFPVPLVRYDDNILTAPITCAPASIGSPKRSRLYTMATGFQGDGATNTTVDYETSTEGMNLHLTFGVEGAYLCLSDMTIRNAPFTNILTPKNQTVMNQIVYYGNDLSLSQGLWNAAVYCSETESVIESVAVTSKGFMVTARKNDECFVFAGLTPGPFFLTKNNGQTRKMMGWNATYEHFATMRV